MDCYIIMLCSMLDYEAHFSIINRNFIGVSKLSVPEEYVFLFQIYMLSVKCRIQNLQPPQPPQQPPNRHRQQQKQQQPPLPPHVPPTLLPVITL